jgi:hypothetical protein
MGTTADAKNKSTDASTTETLEAVPPHGMKQDIRPEPPVSAGFLLVVAGGILMAALGIAAGLQLWSWWRQRRKKPLAQPWQADPSEWEQLLVAIAAIKIPPADALRSEDGQAGKQGRTAFSREFSSEFSSQISLYLRRALELKTGQPFGERTTDEITQWMKQGLDLRGVMEDGEFLMFLESMDRVRFGGGTLSEAEALKTLQRLRDWVQRLEQGVASTKTSSAEETTMVGKLETDAKGGLRVFDA